MKIEKIILLFILLSTFISCSENIEIRDYTLEGGVFGTSYKITYLKANVNYQNSIDSLFFLINNSVSTYIPTSDISKVNNGDSSIFIDDIFKEVFLKSKRIYKETNGFFDPTVGNLVNSYGFGPKNEKINLTEIEIKEEMQFVGLDKIKLEGRKIKKDHPKIYLDFNSIAKGLGIDIVARFLDSKKIENYIIEIGGEIRAKGTKANKIPWIIKLVNPLELSTGYKTINLSGKSMATSGNYRKFRVTATGEKYVHTINPKTGLATESNLLSASVIASLDCADVDAYATAFMVMGLEKTKEFLQKNTNLEVILLFFDKNGDIQEYSTYTYN